jgi:hypothetical protein
MDNVIDQTYIEYMRWIIEGPQKYGTSRRGSRWKVDEQDVSRYENEARFTSSPT